MFKGFENTFIEDQFKGVPSNLFNGVDYLYSIPKRNVSIHLDASSLLNVYNNGGGVSLFTDTLNNSRWVQSTGADQPSFNRNNFLGFPSLNFRDDKLVNNDSKGKVDTVNGLVIFIGSSDGNSNSNLLLENTTSLNSYSFCAGSAQPYFGFVNNINVSYQNTGFNSCEPIIMLADGRHLIVNGKVEWEGSYTRQDSTGVINVIGRNDVGNGRGAVMTLAELLVVNDRSFTRTELLYICHQINLKYNVY